MSGYSRGICGDFSSVDIKLSKFRVAGTCRRNEFYTIQLLYMRNFRIVPLSAAYAATIRESGRDDFGHPVMSQVAKGFGPCRVSLKAFEVGVDERLLFSHSPFEIDNAFNQPGPIFIHKKEVAAYSDVHCFPPEIKADKAHFPLSLIGYSKDQRMVYTKLVGDADVEDLIEEAFEQHAKID